MKKRILIIIAVITLLVTLVSTSVVMAAKPQNAIEMSNGMPSGEHETLLIHGKNASFVCEESTTGGNVVNVPEYTVEGVDETITYVSGKKVKVDNLTVFDTCTESLDGSPAEVWLPYEQEGYWVFARALGKPGKTDDERYIILQNSSLEAYTLLEDASNPGEVIIGLGLITQQGEFKADASGELYRFDGDSDKGKGKSQGHDITDMFLWSGFVFNPVLDINDDEVVSGLDVIADSCPYDVNQNGIIDADELAAWIADTGGPDVVINSVIDALDVIADTCPYDTNQNGVIDYDGVYDETTFPDSEFEYWLNDNTVDAELQPLWDYYEEEWVFTIADLVYLNQVVTNNGIKNLQIRFYPKDTTIFTPYE